MERIEDRSKALSFIGLEIAEALKYIPAPIDEEAGFIAEETPIEEIEKVEEIKVKEVTRRETKVEVKPEKFQMLLQQLLQLIT